jgi:hypothetical protein
MAPPFSGTLIHPGESSNDCWTWQQRMRERGWHLETTGTHDNESELVCRAFQQEKGLLVDGIVGPVTWAAAWDEQITPGPSGWHPISLSVTAHAQRKSNDLVEVSGVVTNHSQSPLLEENRVRVKLRVMGDTEVTLQEHAIGELGPNFGSDYSFEFQCPPRADGGHYDVWVSLYDDTTTHAKADTTVQ